MRISDWSSDVCSADLYKAQFSRDECIAVMGASLFAHAVELDKCVKRPLGRNEAAALLSWSYNVGVGAACRSTLMRKLNAGQAWCGELHRWVYAGGKKLRGLVNRRARSEEHTSELPSLLRISYAVFCLKKK